MDEAQLRRDRNLLLHYILSGLPPSRLILPVHIRKIDQINLDQIDVVQVLKTIKNGGDVDLRMSSRPPPPPPPPSRPPTKPLPAPPSHPPPPGQSNPGQPRVAASPTPGPAEPRGIVVMELDSFTGPSSEPARHDDDATLDTARLLGSAALDEPEMQLAACELVLGAISEPLQDCGPVKILRTQLAFNPPQLASLVQNFQLDPPLPSQQRVSLAYRLELLRAKQAEGFRSVDQFHQWQVRQASIVKQGILEMLNAQPDDYVWNLTSHGSHLGHLTSLELAGHFRSHFECVLQGDSPGVPASFNQLRSNLDAMAGVLGFDDASQLPHPPILCQRLCESLMSTCFDPEEGLPISHESVAQLWVSAFASMRGALLAVPELAPPWKTQGLGPLSDLDVTACFLRSFVNQFHRVQSHEVFTELENAVSEFFEQYQGERESACTQLPQLLASASSALRELLCEYRKNFAEFPEAIEPALKAYLQLEQIAFECRAPQSQ